MHSRPRRRPDRDTRSPRAVAAAVERQRPQLRIGIVGDELGLVAIACSPDDVNVQQIDALCAVAAVAELVLHDDAAGLLRDRAARDREVQAADGRARARERPARIAERARLIRASDGASGEPQTRAPDPYAADLSKSRADARPRDRGTLAGSYRGAVTTWRVHATTSPDVFRAHVHRRRAATAEIDHGLQAVSIWELADAASLRSEPVRSGSLHARVAIP